MQNALGGVQSLLVLGGRSEIGLAIAARFVAGGCSAVTLAVRRPEAGVPEADGLRAAGATVTIVGFDALDPASHTAVIDAVAEQQGDIDAVVCAFGVLGDQDHLDTDPEGAAELAQVNFVGAVSSLLAAADRMRGQGHGLIVVLSSVAGVRPRADNFVYGATKAGLDAFAQGLGDRLVGTGVRVLVVRPGFVTTRMTEGLPPAPMSTTAAHVADAVEAAVRGGAEIVWVPARVGLVMGVLRLLPRKLWRQVSARASRPRR